MEKQVSMVRVDEENPSILKIQDRCIKCGMCARKCPSQAIDVSSGIPVIDYQKCTNCGECVNACPDKVLVLLGQ